MNKPNRHSNHILETKSNKFFSNQIPDEWFLDKPEHDYGIDFTANIVINEQVTGLNFSIQIKGKKTEVKSESVLIKLKYTTLRLYATRLEPVLLVAYVDEDNEAYWLWFDEMDQDLTADSKTLTIHIPKNNKLSEINWEEVIKHVQERFSIKTFVDGIKFLEYKELSNAEVLAWNSYYKGSYESSAYYFKSVLAQGMTLDTTLLEGLAYSEYMLYRYKDALLTINKAIAQSGNVNQFLIKGCILAEEGKASNNRGRLLEAKKIFSEFIERKEANGHYHFNFANTLSYLDENQDAISHYKKCLAVNPNHAEAWKNLGAVYYNVKDHEEEIVCYDRALQLNPKLAPALFSKGVTLSRVFDKNNEGLELMMRSLQEEEDMIRNFPLGYFWIARAHLKTGDNKEALRFINEGLEIDPSNNYMLNFKSSFFVSFWGDDENFKIQARDFFSYRLEAEQHYASLYYLIKIDGITSGEELLQILKKHTKILGSATLRDFEKCNIEIGALLGFLFHYDRYKDFRNGYPISRYSQHFVNPFISFTTPFLFIMDVVMANAFSAAIEGYGMGSDTKEIGLILVDKLMLLANLVNLLDTESIASPDHSRLGFTSLYLEYPTIIIREFGVQFGLITEKLNLIAVEPQEIMTVDVMNKITEDVFKLAMERLKLQ